MHSSLVGVLLFATRAALLACVGGLAFRMRLCLRWFPALVSDCLCIPHHHVSLKHAQNSSVTKRRSSWACIGNPKLEQETSKAHTHKKR